MVLQISDISLCCGCRIQCGKSSLLFNFFPCASLLISPLLCDCISLACLKLSYSYHFPELSFSGVGLHLVKLVSCGLTFTWCQLDLPIETFDDLAVGKFSLYVFAYIYSKHYSSIIVILLKSQTNCHWLKQQVLSWTDSNSYIVEIYQRKYCLGRTRSPESRIFSLFICISYKTKRNIYQ